MTTTATGGRLPAPTRTRVLFAAGKLTKRGKHHAHT
jgi:hypothetical protein